MRCDHDPAPVEPRACQDRSRSSREKPEDRNPTTSKARFGRATAISSLANTEGPQRPRRRNRKAPQFANLLSVSGLSPMPGSVSKEEALDDLAQFQKGDSTESTKLYLAVIVAAELGEGTTRRSRRWKPHSRNSPRTPDCTTMPPVPTPWHRRRSPRRTRRRVGTVRSEPSILLQAAIRNGYSDYNHMQEDADLDPIRDLPAFAEIMKAGHLDRPYAAVWTGDVRFEAVPSSVSIRPLTSSDAGNWRHRAIAWSPCRSPGLHPRGRWSQPRSGTAR